MTSSSKIQPVSRIVCWKCGKGGQKGDAPLRKISPTDYVCLNDLQYGAPETPGMSQVFFKKEEAKKPKVVEKTVPQQTIKVVENKPQEKVAIVDEKGDNKDKSHERPV